MAPKLRNSVSTLALQSELSLLSTTIRAELAAVARAATGMLSHAFAAGDALNKVKKIVDRGDWEGWVGREYGLSLRTAQAYMRLANHREVLEAKAQHAAPFSIRGALRLVGTGMTARDRKRTPALTLKTALWKAANKDERETFVSGIPLTEWLAVIPASWRDDIVDRVDGLRASLAKPVTQPAMKPATKPAIERRAA